MTALDRRVTRLERATQEPEQHKSVRLLFYPVAGSEEDIERFERESAEASDAGEFVIEVVPMRPKESNAAP